MLRRSDCDFGLVVSGCNSPSRQWKMTLRIEEFAMESIENN